LRTRFSSGRKPSSGSPALSNFVDTPIFIVSAGSDGQRNSSQVQPDAAACRTAPGGSGIVQEVAVNTKFSFVSVVALILVLMSVPLAWVAGHGDASWTSRVGFALEILAVYGIGIGFVQKSDALKGVPALEEMTSPNLLKFVRGNALFLGMLNSLVWVGLGPRAREASQGLGALGVVLVLSAFPALLLYCVLHVLLIMPLAYLGYLFTSAIVEGIAGSVDDAEWTESVQGGVVADVRLRLVIADNRTAMKSFLIGIPATMFGMALKGLEILS
jgi:hypothetical protein